MKEEELGDLVHVNSNGPTCEADLIRCHEHIKASARPKIDDSFALSAISQKQHNVVSKHTHLSQPSKSCWVAAAQAQIRALGDASQVY